MIVEAHPKVSVVLPYYNAEKTLERAIRSILDQTHSNIELLLVNNNSTDKSEEIALEFSAKDERIKLLSEPQQGVAFAANAGNKSATGTFFARMDADDYSYPTRIEKQVEFLIKNPNIGVVSCLVNHVGHHSKTEGLQKFVEWANSIQTPQQISLNRFIEAPVINPTVLFRKELLANFGEFRHGDFPEDYELWLRWLSYGVQIQKIPEVLFDWYDSDSRLTRTDDRYSTEAFYRTKTNYLIQWLTQNQKTEVWIWGAGRISRKRVSLLESKGITIEGFIDVKARKIEDKPCINYLNINWEKTKFILSYVGNWGAREKIRSFLISEGKAEGVDFILVA